MTQGSCFGSCFGFGCECGDGKGEREREGGDWSENGSAM